MKSEFVMMAGLPGSGKSTMQAHYENYETFSTDNLIEEYAAEMGSTYSAVFENYIKTATRIANASLSEWIKAGANVIWDQTNLGSNTRVVRLERFYGPYWKTLVFLVPPSNVEEVAELKRRLNSRTGKYISWKLIMQMFENFELPSEDEIEEWDTIHYCNGYSNKAITRQEAEYAFTFFRQYLGCPELLEPVNA